MEKEIFAFPLSFSQERLWFLDQLQPNSSAYTLPLFCRMRAAVNVEALERSLTEVVRRHESLRTTFGVVEGQPAQLVHPPEAFRLPVTELGQLEAREREAEARRLAAVEAREPFRLDRGPLFRARLLRLDEQDHVLLLSMHHIVSDGWSVNVLLRELQVLYENYCRGEAPSLPEPAIQYGDFALWQREWLQGEALDEQTRYWREQLAGAPPVLEIPTGRVRPPVRSYRSEVENFVLNRELAERLRQLALQEGTTLFMVLLAGFQVLLARYTGQWDVVVGTPVANRNRAELEGLIGFFANTLLLRTRMGDDPSFLEVLRRVKEATLSAYTHQDLPFEILVKELQPQRDLGRNPLFQVMFIFQNARTAQAAAETGSWDVSGIDVGTSKFDLTMFVGDAGDELAGSIEYDAELYDPGLMRGMISHWRRLLEGIAAQPVQRVSRLPLLTEGERRRVLAEWNSTGAAYDRTQCLHEMFERQAARTPELPALECNGEVLSYRELNERSNRLAHALQSRGVGPEVRVGLSLGRAAEMLVAVLAVLKAGGAYVPLDPAYPERRLNYMLADARVSVLLTEGEVAEALTQKGLSAENPRGGVSPANLAYVIYTSGSTGNPKGVAITHQSAVCFLTWAGQFFPGEALRCVLASTSLSFDLAVFELFAPVSTGGRVVLVNDALSLAESSRRSADESGITLINTVPSAMQALLDVNAVPDSVRVVNLAGEALPRELVNQIYTRAGVRHVYNLYGPTEDTTYSTAGEQPRDATAVDIGRPISNTQVYLLDPNMEPVPAGLPGELYLGGEGLARGYLNQPGLTANAFVPNPYSQSPGARMYRTGDLARYGDDGRLYFLGRKDHQIKLRGFRIEIGEVEAALASHTGVREAAVMLRADNFGDSYLAAYVVSGEGGTAELRAFLRERLPEYMVPSVFVRMDELPRTENGKINRAALPSPDGAAASGAAFEPPRTDTEKRLADLWSELLSNPVIGIHDNFFSLGGHSLAATRMVSKLRAIFRIDMALRSAFDYPTIAELAREVERHLGGSAQAPIPRAASSNPDIERLSEAEIDAMLEELRREEGIV